MSVALKDRILAVNRFAHPRKPRRNEDQAFIETAVLMMSLEAYRQKRQVRWDAVNEEIV